ncbi:MAG TPA: adenylate/guanylate cyclase domain-containing protein [Solimonas sp.]|nr:adenylate/guanylate cyclase domain-containing protein [Solimonas sp.]
MLRDFALTACRLLALCIASVALFRLPALLALAAASEPPAPVAWIAPGLGFFLAVALASLLWGFAPQLAVVLAGDRDARYDALVTRREWQRLAAGTAGAVLLIAGLGEAGVAVAQTQRAALAFHAFAALLGVSLSLWLLLDGPRAVTLLRRWAGDPEPATAAADLRPSRVLGELIASAGVVGIKSLTDLALTLGKEAEGVAKQVVRSSLDAVIGAVERRRPDFSAATAADGTVTIAFSDMEGFSAMTERLGDQAAHRLVQLHNRIVRKALKKHRGQEVELQGDGFLLAFADSANALRCACDIQRSFADYSRRHPEEPMRVRIGLHTGTPIKEGERFFGITVILAARIAGQAAGGEILASSVLHEAQAASGEFRFGTAREAELKGLAGTHRMHPVRWD